MPLDVPPLSVMPAVDDVRLGMLELVAMGDDQGGVHDFVVAGAFLDDADGGDAGSASVEWRRLGDLLGPDGTGIVERLVACVERAEAESFLVLTPHWSRAFRVIPTAPGRLVVIWADLTQLRQHRRTALREASDAELVMSLSEPLVAIVDAEGRCVDAWPGTGVARLTRHELVGFPLASALGFDPLATSMSDHGDVVVVRPLADGRRVVTIAPVSSEAVALTAARLELARLRAMLASTGMGMAVYEAVRDDAGTLIDFVCVEATDRAPILPDALEIGTRLAERYPEVKANGTFAAYQRVIEDGVTLERDPVRVSHEPHEPTTTTTVVRYLDGVIVSWRDDGAGERGPGARATTSQGSPVGGPLFVLSARHTAILTLIADGATTDEIARTVHLSPFTVRNEVRRILSRLGVRSRAEAIATALRHGLIPPGKAPTADQ